MSKIKTRGEVWLTNKIQFANSKGVDHYNPWGELPKPLTHEETVRKYNRKLLVYWAKQLKTTLKAKTRLQIISALMFGHTKKYETLKEKKVHGMCS